ncbi:unnamed protein product [Dicrocoelium dendriticum]|nr:unnamed protein product [Dicrocoelium dendriticum]
MRNYGVCTAHLPTLLAGENDCALAMTCRIHEFCDTVISTYMEHLSRHTCKAYLSAKSTKVFVIFHTSQSCCNKGTEKGFT